MNRSLQRCLRAAALAGLAGSGLVVAVAPVASAATITVTTTADTVDGADGKTSLREAFITAGSNGADDTIVLGAGLTYTLTDCPAGALAHAEAHQLVVQGNGSVIDQGCDATPIIDSSHHGGRLELQDLTIDGGPNAAATGIEGAAVHSESELQLSGVEIRNVLSPGGSVVWSSFGHGTTPYRMTLADSNLHDNTGTVVTCDNCSLQVTSSSIGDNTGSGISLVDGYPVEITGSAIANNTRAGISNTGQGFAVNRMTIDTSQIQDNGRVGIRCGNCGGLSMYSTTVTNNGLTAVDALGGIAYSMSQRNGVPASTIGIILSTITGNKSTAPGGGLAVAPVLVEPGGSVADTGLDRVIVEGNQSVGGGGGVFVGVGTVHTYKGSLSSNSTTGDGGGLAYAVTDGPYDVSLDETEVRNNTAGGKGGGVFADEVMAFIAGRSYLSGNTAAGDGGGLKIGTALIVRIEDEEISGNAGANGGGLDIATETLNLAGSTVSGNTLAPATGTGGGARVAAIAAELVNDTFSGNKAGTGGGLAFTTQTTAALTHVTMADDTATIGAHVAAVPGADVTTSRSALVLPLTGTSCAGIGGAFAGTSGGFSVLRDATCGSIASDLVTAADPQLGPLADNGRLTRLPAPTSPLGGRVPVASCTLDHDQRGQVRPMGPNCDAGSVEIVEAPASPDQATKALIAEVKALHLPKLLEASLVLKLELARVALYKGHKPAAKASLTAFIVEVKSQAGKKIPAPSAAQLVTKATTIRSAL